MTQCQAIGRINRVGNGFNGHTGDYQCKAEAVTTAEYQIRDAGSLNLIAVETLPACAKHAAPAAWYRRTVKRIVKAVR